MPKRRYQSPPEILSKPIKAYEFSADERDQKVSAEVEKRINAAVEYFGTDAGQYKWEMLSYVLLLRVFPDGFTVLNKPRAGAKKNSEDAYRELADNFDSFVAKQPRRSALLHAKKFIGPENKLKVGKETITSPKVLLRAVRRGRAERKRQHEQLRQFERRLEQEYYTDPLVRYGIHLALAGAGYGPMNAPAAGEQKKRTL
jgi:hypothetical protein